MKSGLSKKKSFQLIFVFILLLICWGLLELVTPWLFSATQHREWNSKEVEGTLLEIAQFDKIVKEEESGLLKFYRTHPYLGYVRNPQDSAVNSLGFLGSELKTDSLTYDVVILGGSFAKIFWQHEGILLKNHLEKKLNRKVSVQCMAMGGYKQPQQLLALNYSYYLGTKWDLVINIDGFNELVLPYSENLVQQIDPSFPRSWGDYAKKNISIDELTLYGSLAQIKINQNEISKTFENSLFRFSRFYMFLKYRSFDELEQKKRRVQAELNRLKKGTNLVFSGHVHTYQNADVFFEEQTQRWKNGSKAIQSQCKSTGAEYIHILQPNQYVVNSKPFHSKELALMPKTNEKHVYKKAVNLGYNQLIDAGRQLSKEFVFLDATMIYKDVKEPLYIDDCCHVNESGNEIFLKFLIQGLDQLKIIKNKTGPN